MSGLTWASICDHLPPIYPFDMRDTAALTFQPPNVILNMMSSYHHLDLMGGFMWR